MRQLSNILVAQHEYCVTRMNLLSSTFVLTLNTWIHIDTTEQLDSFPLSDWYTNIYSLSDINLNVHMHVGGNVYNTSDSFIGWSWGTESTRPPSQEYVLIAHVHALSAYAYCLSSDCVEPCTTRRCVNNCKSRLYSRFYAVPFNTAQTRAFLRITELQWRI